MKVKLPNFRDVEKKNRVLKWIALLNVCQYTSHNNRTCKGHDLQIKIKRRLVRDYGFDNNYFANQMNSPKFHRAYNSVVSGLIQKWNKYLERLEN
jgi:hypothetical protein